MWIHVLTVVVSVPRKTTIVRIGSERPRPQSANAHLSVSQARRSRTPRRAQLLSMPFMALSFTVLITMTVLAFCHFIDACLIPQYDHHCHCFRSALFKPRVLAPSRRLDGPCVTEHRNAERMQSELGRKVLLAGDLLLFLFVTGRPRRSFVWTAKGV